MKDTLLYILTHIVDHPEAIEIVEQTDNERIIYLLTVAQEDMEELLEHFEILSSSWLQKSTHM